MRKLVVLVIGLMISVSAFAKPSDDKFEEFIDNLLNRTGEIMEQCYDNDNDDEHKFDKIMAMTKINLVIEQIETAYNHGASYRFIALDNYIYVEAEDNILEYEIDGDVVIVTLGWNEHHVEYTFNANGEFFDTRIR